MKNQIVNKKILIMATDGFEQSELEKPKVELQELGATVHVAAPKKSPIKGWKDGEWCKPVNVDLTLDEVEISDYDALVIPGGVMNPDKLRTEKRAVDMSKMRLNKGRLSQQFATVFGC